MNYPILNKYSWISVCLFLFMCIYMMSSLKNGKNQFLSVKTPSPSASPLPTIPHLQIKSIDTMKYSRDLARVKLHDATFDTVIDQQIMAIAETGANYVAINTPYDEEFVPFLTRWIDAARKYNLHIWFRGNFSGWERWFGYPRITALQHQQLLRQFIVNHHDLFLTDDIFTSCTECENGSLGDPRNTGNVEDFRSFLIQEYQLSSDLFQQFNIPVHTGYYSMNYQTATLVMDRKTAAAVGHVVVIDHYVADPDQLIDDIHAIANQSDGKVILGEFGVPIPDINGDMSENQRVIWLNRLFTSIQHLPDVIGLNYWVNVGGSTALWEKSGAQTPSVSAITAFYLE